MSVSKAVAAAEFWHQKIERSEPLGWGHKVADALRRTPARPVPSRKVELADPINENYPPHPSRPRSLE